MAAQTDIDLRVRNERWLLAAVLGYSALVVTLMVLGGLNITPDVLVVAFLLVAVLMGRTRLFLRDWLPFSAIFLASELMRGIADDAGFPVHVGDVIAAERLISFGQLPTQLLQDWLAPTSGVGIAAIIATVLYMLHFALPIVTGFLLWVWRRSQYYEFVAAFILLSFAGFVTYLLLPVAPPWWAADNGQLNGPTGEPLIRYLKPDAFAVIADRLGFDGRWLTSYVFYGGNPNGVAAFPSLHAGYPFLSFLVLRRAFGRIGWLALAYAVAVWWAIVFTGDHYLVDVLGGIAYASAAYLATPRSGLNVVCCGPRRIRGTARRDPRATRPDRPGRPRPVGVVRRPAAGRGSRLCRVRRAAHRGARGAAHARRAGGGCRLRGGARPALARGAAPGMDAVPGPLPGVRADARPGRRRGAAGPRRRRRLAGALALRRPPPDRAPSGLDGGAAGAHRLGPG